MDELLEASEEEMPEDKLAGQLDRANAEKASEIAARALQEIEAISGDSKLDAFGRLLSDLNEAKMPVRRICVITQFVGTLYYLAAEIEGRGMACQLLHGGMGAEDRHKSLTLFLDSGVILVATMAVMTEGFVLPEVTDLILYDVPGSKILLQQVLGRFDRFGRRQSTERPCTYAVQQFRWLHRCTYRSSPRPSCRASQGRNKGIEMSVYHTLCDAFAESIRSGQAYQTASPHPRSTRYLDVYSAAWIAGLGDAGREPLGEAPKESFAVLFWTRAQEVHRGK